jgi:DNA repair protein RadC
MKMSDKPKDSRPREKLIKKGASALSDFELLQALIGSGVAGSDVSQIARKLQKLIAEGTSELQLEDVASIKGMGTAKAVRFMAAYELWKRHFQVTDRPIIDSPEKAVEQLADIRDKKQEYFVCLTLDGANRLIAKRIITIGTLTASLVHPREVFADAITDRAASIIIAHNHPSGSITPSTADLEVTERIKKAAELLGVKLNDHIIVTKIEFSSIL